MHPSAPASRGAHGALLTAPGVTAGHHTSAHPPGGPAAAPTPDGHAAPSSSDEPSDGHPADVAQACVAVLAGAALLALLLPGAHRALALARPAVHRSVLRDRIPPLPALRPPDFSVLCVLRT